MEKLKQKIIRALRWSEKYTKTDMVYLAGGGFWMTIGTIASGLISFATSVAFANLFSKESYGTYQYVIGLVDVFGITVLSGIDTAVTRSVARGMDGNLKEALLTKIKWGSIGGAISGIAGAYYYLNGNHLLGSAFLITMFFIPLWEAPSFYVGYLQGKKRFDLITIYETLGQFITATVIIICLLKTNNILVVLTGYFLSWGLIRGISLAISIKQLPPNKTKDPNLIGYGKHLTIMSAINNISSNIDRVLLWHFLGPIQVALYVFAQSIPMRISGFIKSINRLAFPKMATSELSVLKKTLPKKILLASFFSILIAVFYIAISPLFFSLFFPQYKDAVFFTQLLSALIILQPFSLIISSLSAQAEKKSLYIYHFGMPIIRIFLFFVLIPKFHLLGAVSALIIAKVVDVIFSFILFRTKQ